MKDSSRVINSMKSNHQRQRKNCLTKGHTAAAKTQLRIYLFLLFFVRKQSESKEELIFMSLGREINKTMKLASAQIRPKAMVESDKTSL